MALAAEPPLPLSGPAYALADAAYHAYARADYARAAALAREAIRQRPDFEPLQGLLRRAEAAARTRAPGPATALSASRGRLGVAGAAAAGRARSASAPAPARLPPASSAFAAAAAAYAAYDRGDFAAAVAQAGAAVRLAPADRRYRQLLVNSLAALGRIGEALRAGENGIAQAGDDGSLAATLVPLRRALALAPASAAFAALDRGDAAAAVVAAREAMRLVPGSHRYGALLVEALLRSDRYGAAEEAAGRLIAPVAPEPAAADPAAADPVALALRGYARQRLGRRVEAGTDFERAIRSDGIDVAQRRALSLIAADAALAAQEPQRALALLQAMPGADAADVLDRRREAGAALVAGGPAYRLAPLRLDCSRGDDASVCRIGPGARPDRGLAAAAAAYGAYARRSYVEAAELAALAVEAAPAVRAYRELLIDAWSAAGRLDEAEAAATAALVAQPGDARLMARRGLIRDDRGQADAARGDLQAALDAGGLAPVTSVDVLLALGRKGDARERFLAARAAGELAGMSSLDLAFLAVRVGADREALAAFAAADERQQLRGAAYNDAAYAALRSGDDAHALGYFERRLETASADVPPVSPQALFETRRAVSEVSRSAGVFASVIYGGTMPGTGLATGARTNSLQAGVEGYWRPWGYRDGRYAELFARAFQTLSSDDGGATGGDSRQAAFGIRDKPFKSLNLVVSLARVFSAGSGRDDWLAQLGYSGGSGTDLRVDMPAWWTTRLYAEAGRYLSTGQTYGLVHGEAGRSFRLGGSDGRWVLFPHLSAAADRDSTAAERSAAGLGAGVAARYWFREDSLHAPRSYVDLSLQYRARVAGGARGGGPFVALTLAY